MTLSTKIEVFYGFYICSQWAFIHALLSRVPFALAGLSCTISKYVVSFALFVQSVSGECTASVVVCRAIVTMAPVVIASRDGVPALRVGPDRRVTFPSVSPNPLLLLQCADY